VRCCHEVEQGARGLGERAALAAIQATLLWVMRRPTCVETVASTGPYPSLMILTTKPSFRFTSREHGSGSALFDSSTSAPGGSVSTINASIVPLMMVAQPAIHGTKNQQDENDALDRNLPPQETYRPKNRHVRVPSFSIDRWKRMV
jgi:hypothetical protein